MKKPETLADRLRFARQERRLTQEELAQAAGVGVATVRRAEGGSFEPRLDTIRRLADTLEVRVGWLAAGEEPMAE